MKRIRLFIADVDGTLLTQDKALTTQAREAIQRLHDAGVGFTMTSGRPPRGMAMFTDVLKRTCPIAAFNGGMLVMPDLSTVLDQKTIPLSVASGVVDDLLKAGLDVWVYRGSDWFVRNMDAPHVAKEQRTVQFAPTVIADLQSVLNGAVKIVGVSDDAALVARCESELRGRLQGLASASRSQPYYLDVTHPDANKGMAVRMIASALQIPLEEVAVMGDMPNDVLMFGVAGTSIAMGNASPEVQRTARYVTRSNEQEGFAYAVNRFILSKEQAPRKQLGLPEGIQACLFDLDGVLTQTSKLHAAAWKQIFDEYLRKHAEQDEKPFVPFDVVHDYAEYVDGKLRVDGARSFLESRGIHLSEGEVQALAAQKDEILLEILRHQHVETYQGSVRYVYEARQAGLRTAVVSSSKHCEQFLASAGIADLFDIRIDGNIASQQHLASKPSPDTFLAAAKILGVDPSHAAVFEDALSGVEAGRSGHFGYVVGVDRLGQGAKLRCHGADIVVSDLSALLAPLLENAA
jgi:hypothetical protein